MQKTAGPKKNGIGGYILAIQLEIAPRANCTSAVDLHGFNLLQAPNFMFVVWNLVWFMRGLYYCAKLHLALLVSFHGSRQMVNDIMNQKQVNAYSEKRNGKMNQNYTGLAAPVFLLPVSSAALRLRLMAPPLVSTHHLPIPPWPQRVHDHCYQSSHLSCWSFFFFDV